MRYWLMKSEPSEFSIDDLVRARGQTTPWVGVRNYQARNYMRDGMQLGDRAFFYHSSCAEPGIAGIVEISRLAYPDATQFDKKSPYYDAKSTGDTPRWVHVDVKLVKKTALVTLPMLRATPGLDDMVVLRKGNRLSITPVTPAEWKIVGKLASGVLMDWTLIPVLLAIGAVIGFLAGLLGVGGGLTLVPLLTLLFTAEHFPSAHVVHMAVATATATMVFTSMSSVRAHQRQQRGAVARGCRDGARHRARLAASGRRSRAHCRRARLPRCSACSSGSLQRGC